MPDLGALAQPNRVAQIPVYTAIVVIIIVITTAAAAVFGLT
jgi:hypothetical protein